MSILCESSVVAVGSDSDYTRWRYEHDGYLREDTRSNVYYTPPETPNQQLELLLHTPSSSSSNPSFPGIAISNHLPSESQPDSSTKPESAIRSTSPTSLLTQELVDVGEEVLSAYDAVRVKSASPSPEILSKNPFSTFSTEELEAYYSAAVDVRNALDLRKSVVKADIGDSLEVILPKLSLYQRDDAVLDVMTCLHPASTQDPGALSEVVLSLWSKLNPSWQPCMRAAAQCWQKTAVQEKGFLFTPASRFRQTLRQFILDALSFQSLLRIFHGQIGWQEWAVVLNDEVKGSWNIEKNVDSYLLSPHPSPLAWDMDSCSQIYDGRKRELRWKENGKTREGEIYKHTTVMRVGDGLVLYNGRQPTT
ncbi:hypothetical protein BDN70DRAFT_901212 [Pholiota conissans]|uniref:Uncharacterized protein n=1 Tax=Pholiota conissans TaxID=109636 RepID=A0A9P6CT01_9AGAR|nr:hypothetical protein BDN70DRAFT_901212 [Pholiota conissans]